MISEKVKKLLPLIVMLVSLVLAYLMVTNKPEARKRTVRQSPPAVEVIRVKPESRSAVIKTQGTVEAETISTLVSRVSGEVVWVSENFRAGGFFHKGEMLLKIDPVDYELAIKSAKAALAEAQFVFEEEKARSDQARENWKRLGREGEPGALVLRQPQLAKARAQVESAEAQLQRAQLDLKRTAILAPYSGRVLERYVDIGQYLSPGNEVIRVFATDRVEIRLPLTKKQRSLLELPYYYQEETGEKIEEPAFPVVIGADVGGQWWQWKGELVRVEGAFDRETRQQFIVVAIDAPYTKGVDGRPPLEIGQYVQATLQGRHEAGLFLLPRSAVHSGREVMIVNEEDRAERRKVSILWEESDQVVVKSGIETGERVSKNYLSYVANGALVKPLFSESEVSDNQNTEKAGVMDFPKERQPLSESTK